MEKFQHIYSRAAERKGGRAALESLLSKPLTEQRLRKLEDSYYLSELTKKVFQSGFVWRVVEQKWPQFEEIFWQFDIEKLLLMPPDMLEQKAQDPKIIRNFNKVKSIVANAQMIQQAAKDHGSFANLVADWPSEDIVGLWDYLKKKGARLGGNTGPYALRVVGKDTFIISRDVEQYLRTQQLIDGGATSKKSLNAAQQSFNLWQQESGRSLQEISQIIAYSCGDNYAGVDQ